MANLNIYMSLSECCVQVPRTVELYFLDMPIWQVRRRLKEEFLKNSHVRDPRVIDMLVIKVGNTRHAMGSICWDSSMVPRGAIVGTLEHGEAFITAACSTKRHKVHSE